MHTSTENDPAATAGRREWLGLLVLVLPAFLLAVDMSVLHLALPHLAKDLQPSSTQQLWILDIYGFMLAGFLVTMGTLGDRIGRRKLLLIGGAFFAVASVLAAYATSPEMLIAARALLGIAGATLAPSTLALITNMFKNPKQRGVAVAVWTSCFVGGGVFGPIIGGFMLSAFWWGSVLLLAVPVMALLLIAGPLLLPEYRNGGAGRLDLFSVVLSLLTILPFMYGIKEIAHGWATLPVVALVAGVLFGVLFVRRQGQLADPLLDLGLFKIRDYRSALLLSLLVGTITGGALLLVNLQLQMVEGLSPWKTGLCLAPSAFGVLVTISLATGLATKVRPAYLMAGGLLAAAAGYVVLSQVPSSDSVGMVVLGAILINGGLGPTVALGYGMVTTAAPPEKTGSASALSETSGEFGVAAGIAILGSIGTAVYRDQISVPDGLSADTAEAAREGIANAVALVPQLSGPQSGELLTSAREAFTSGLNVVGALAAVLFVGLAALAWHWFRHMPPAPAPAPAPAADAAESAAGSQTVGSQTAEPMAADAGTSAKESVRT
ncbi:MFS transporter [Streptomyces sp. H34-S4]|uniref:MFS transporter n=1 Tax=Streptomyces sp. H34-S4 TaxID=2996463 RepID=UPI002271E4BC|nr:MFS transporter [Streptomyces sp. H34-S4]MCY0937606.1 MFS transporter [Streptomyces sp. H34-S4]